VDHTKVSKELSFDLVEVVKDSLKCLESKERSMKVLFYGYCSCSDMVILSLLNFFWIPILFGTRDRALLNE